MGPSPPSAAEDGERGAGGLAEAPRGGTGGSVGSSCGGANGQRRGDGVGYGATSRTAALASGREIVTSRHPRLMAASCMTN